MTFGSAGPGKHKDSDSSHRSRVSTDSGAVEPQQHPQGKGEGKGKTSNHKEAAVWTVKEEVSLLDFLYCNKMGMDGVTFNKKVYLAAAALLTQQYTDQKGGKKTYAACKTKFSSLKSSYHAAVDLKFGGLSLGFTWTDDGGACIDDSSASVWAGYVKSHSNTKQFQNKGFPHFDIFNLLTASNATNGIHVHRIPPVPVVLISFNAVVPHLYSSSVTCEYHTYNCRFKCQDGVQGDARRTSKSSCTTAQICAELGEWDMHKRMWEEHACDRFPRILWAGYSSEGVLEKGIFAAVCGLDCDGTGMVPMVHMLER
ncbi:hypothetical protein BDR05DRAFT_1025627 [Suillus weaverae]|nr:hypothetical protein BDR05DRAFT_1025627 [Suillus weaverae]